MTVRFVSSLLFLLLLLPNCAQQRSCKKIQSELRGFTQKKDNVQCTVRPVNSQESKQIFGNNVMSAGFHPLEINIKNDADSFYILSPTSLSVDLTSPKKVSQKFFPLWQFIVVFTPIEFACLVANRVDLYLFTFFGYLVSASWYNNRLIKRYTTKAMNTKHSVTIPPHTELTTYIFVEQNEFKPEFSLNLINGKDGNSLPFHVVLSAPKTV